jgi:hypothetical protein
LEGLFSAIALQVINEASQISKEREHNGKGERRYTWKTVPCTGSIGSQEADLIGEPKVPSSSCGAREA